jgi:hypothetical protein
MTVESNLLPTPQAGATPHPFAPETIALVEQLLAGVLHSLRAEAGRCEAQEAGATEYDSWLRQLH